MLCNSPSLSKKQRRQQHSPFGNGDDNLTGDSCKIAGQRAHVQAMSAPAGAELLDYISWPSVECLNAQPDHGAANALKQVLPVAPLCKRSVTLWRPYVIAGRCSSHFNSASLTAKCGL